MYEPNPPKRSANSDIQDEMPHYAAFHLGVALFAKTKSIFNITVFWKL